MLGKSKSWFGRWVLAGASAAVILAPRADATIYHVKAAGVSIGGSWDQAADLRTALLLSQSGDEIWVAEGTYKPVDRLDPNNPRTATFSLKPGVAVYGGFEGVETAREQRDWRAFRTVLSGDITGNDGANFTNYAENVYHVLIGANSATLDGFTVRSGNANNPNSNHDKGAGMFVGWNNTAASTTVSNCVFMLNFAEFGQGAGMFIHAGSAATIVHSTFLSNKAFLGAGVYNSSSSPSFVNCVFASNVAQSGGGAMYNFHSAPTLVNCTMNKNTANAGASVYNQNTTTGGASASIVNSILWGSNQEVFRANSNPSFQNSDVQACGGSGAGWNSACGTDGGGNIALDPGFVNALDADGLDDIAATFDDGLRLQNDSSCVNEGTSTGAPASDLLFVPRPQQGLFDMGAYEYISTPPTATPTRTPSGPTATPAPPTPTNPPATSTRTPTSPAASTPTPTGPQATATRTHTVPPGSTPTRTFTQGPPPTSTHTPGGPTATVTPAESGTGVNIGLVERVCAPGAAIRASGTAPDGFYRLCIVPNRAYSRGVTYSETPVACAPNAVQVLDQILPPTTVWTSAATGSYDLLVLAVIGPGTGQILGGDDLGSKAGLLVATTTPLPNPAVPALLLLLPLSAGLLAHRRRSR